MAKTDNAAKVPLGDSGGALCKMTVELESDISDGRNEPGSELGYCDVM